MSENVYGGKALAKAVREAYLNGADDYYMEPMSEIDDKGEGVGRIKDGDAVIFCCRRGEREVELTDAFTDDSFAFFDRKKLNDLDFVILTMYHEKYTDIPIAFAPEKGKNTLAECISKAGKNQFHCAESEKYAHVTYFLNGGNNAPFEGETDFKIPSPKGVPFDSVPELSLPLVAKEVENALEKGYDFIVTNFANGDVIGHTSNSEAKVACAAAVDKYLGEVLEKARKEGYVTAITADHGNLELLYTDNGKPHVAHTANPVAFIIDDPKADSLPTPKEGKLGDISPTVLHVLGIEKPADMDGADLMDGYDFGENRKMLLIILDGWGLGEENETNPIFTADTPVWDKLLSHNPWSKLRASGEAVGLQGGKPGNSEAGHSNIGAGHVVLQDDVRLDKAMTDGSFEKNEVFLDTMKKVKERGGNLHLLALLTKKSSHGSIDYPLMLLKMAKEAGLNEVFVHIIFDGRSTLPGSAPDLLEELEENIKSIGIGRIVDGVGRGIVLDRDGNYAKIEKSYNMLLFGAPLRYDSK